MGILRGRLNMRTGAVSDARDRPQAPPLQRAVKKTPSGCYPGGVKSHTPIQR
jgi:hypothetical protein